MATKRKKNLAISPWLILVIVIVCAVGGLLLMPSKRALLERQVRDRQTAEALKTLQGIPEREKNKDPLFYLLTDLRLKAAALNPEDVRAREELIVQACRGAIEHQFHPDILELLAGFINGHPDPHRALESSRHFLPQFPSKVQEEIVNRLASAFLRENKPALAAATYTDFLGRVPANEARVHESVRLWRLAGKPEEALRKTRELLASGSFAGSIALAQLHIALLREAGSPEEAFLFTWDLYQKGDLSVRQELYTQLIPLAREVNRVAEILGEVEKQAATQPEEVDAWINLREMGTAANQLEIAVKAAREVARLKPDSGTDIFKLAQLCEWNNQPEEAFSTYVSAMKFRENRAGDRILALAPGLARDLEATALLNAFPDFVSERNMEFQMAQLNERSGYFDEAERWYVAALEKRPGDLDALKAYGNFSLGLYEYDRAVELFQKAEKLAPEDITVTTALAEAYYRSGDYDKAHALLARAVEKTGNDRLVQSLLTLSESLQRVDTLVAVLRGKISSDSASVDDHRRLAVIYEQTGRETDLVATLKTGLLKYPESAELRLRLAEYFMDRTDFLEGAKVLEGTGLVKTNVAAMQMYLEFLVQAQKFGPADQFFATHLPANVKDTEVFLNLRAGIAEGLERKEEAHDVYKRLYTLKPGNIFYAMNYARLLADLGKTREALALLEKFKNNPNPETMRLMAQVLSAAGRLKEAEEWQMRYLHSNPSDLPQAFGFLGDVRLSRGDKLNARRAYRSGLQAMLQEVSSRTPPAAPRR